MRKGLGTESYPPDLSLLRTTMKTLKIPYFRIKPNRKRSIPLFFSVQKLKIPAPKKIKSRLIPNPKLENIRYSKILSSGNKSAHVIRGFRPQASSSQTLRPRPWVELSEYDFNSPKIGTNIQSFL